MNKKNLECKYIAKKQKFGRLGKLRLYCEIYQHQSQDPMSYRNHLQSESHRKMTSHFQSSSDLIIQQNSQIFEKSFLDILPKRFPNKEVPANFVYSQLIQDKNHVQMNSTRWESVKGFCYHLQQKGKIELRISSNIPFIKAVPKGNLNQNYFEIEREKIFFQRQPQKKILAEKAPEKNVDEVDFIHGQIDVPEESQRPICHLFRKHK
jgi:DNA/RNA-binding protein KIN17